MRVFASLLKLLLGSNLQGSGVRLMYIILLGAGWIMGDRFGVPDQLDGIVDQGLEMIGDLLPGEEASAE